MSMSWVPIMSLLVQARLLPPEHALLVAEMADEAMVASYVSFLDPLMRKMGIWSFRGQDGLNLVKAKIQEKVGIPLEQQILILAGIHVDALDCFVLNLKVRVRVMQNVSLQNVLVGNLHHFPWEHL